MCRNHKPQAARLVAGWLLAFALAGCSAEKSSSAASMSMKSDSASGASAPAGGEWRTLFDGGSLAGLAGIQAGRRAGGLASGGRRAHPGRRGRRPDHPGPVRRLRADARVEGRRGRQQRDHLPGHRGPPTATYETGPEMQVLDDARHEDGESRLTAAGSAYGLYPAPERRGEAGRASGTRRGSWSSGNHVEHWLNGTKVVEYELGSPDWEARVAASKFKQWPGYGRAAAGHIALQDHGDRVAYRNIKIRTLP